MRTGSEGIALIKQFEGLRLDAYRDAVGVWTIGYGHTRTAHEGMTITEDEAEALLRADLADAEAQVARRMAGANLTQNEFDALVSFIFNLGPSPFHSTSTGAALRSGDRQAIAGRIPKWVYAGGRVLHGLVRRRNAERALFLGQDWRGC